MSHGKIGTCKFTFINVQFTAVFVVYLAVCCNQLLLEVNWSFWIACPCEVEVKSPYYSAEMHTQFTCRQTTWERGRIYCLKDLSFKQAKTASGKFFFSHFEMWNITYPPLCRPHSWRQLGALDTGTRKKSPSFQRRYEFGHDMTITHARVIFKPICKYFDDRLLAEHSRKEQSWEFESMLKWIVCHD